MKILQINKFFFEQGGAEYYFFNLIKLLEEKGHQVIPFAMVHPKNFSSTYTKYFPSYVETERAKISLRSLKTVGRMFYSFSAKRKIESLIKTEKPDIAHVHNIYHQISPSILPVLKKYHLPVVMTVHDYKLISPNYILYAKGAPLKEGQGGKYYQTFLNRSLKNSYSASALVTLETYFHKALKIYEKNIDFFIAPSNFVKEMLVEFGLEANKIVVVPHFVNYKLIEPAYGEGCGYFLYLGRLKEEKGVDVLIRAMEYLPEGRLKIVGDGPQEEELKNLVKEKRLKNVSFFGKLKHSAVEGFFKEALAVVTPSRVWETFGLSPAEAMSWGKPVIASKMGALPEIVEEKETGLLFESENAEDLAEKMDFLLQNPKVAELMGRKGRKKVEEILNPEKHYKNIIKIYEKARTV